MKYTLALTVPLLLAACANESYIGGNDYDSSYIPGEHLLYGPAVQTYVRGNPFPGLSEQAGVAAVLADMQDAGFSQTAFTTDRIGRSPYRVVMLFQPEAGVGLEQLCEIDPQPIPSPPPRAANTVGTRIGLAAVLCRANKTMSGARGSIPTAANPDDPLVKGSIQGFVRQLFPANNPALSGGAGNDPQ